MDKPKVYLVIGQDAVEIVSGIKEYAEVVGWDYTLSELLLQDFRRSQQPEVLFINSGVHFGQKTEPGVNKEETFIEILTQVRTKLPESRIVIVLPTSRGENPQFVQELMQITHDFYFNSTFTDRDIRDMIFTRKIISNTATFAQPEPTAPCSTDTPPPFQQPRPAPARISVEPEETPEEEQSPESADPSRQNAIPTPPATTWSKSHVIKADVVAFWSPEHAAINHGAAYFTALKLAASGFKVALIEPLTEVRRLVYSCKLKHPYYNTSHAVHMTCVEKNRAFINNCLLNSTKYIHDEHTDKDILADYKKQIKALPETLYLLPDIKTKNSNPTLRSHWNEFAMSLFRKVMLEEKFDFLLFDYSGTDPEIVQPILDLSNLKFVTLSLHPASVEFYDQLSDRYGDKIQLIGSHYVESAYQDNGIEYIFAPEGFEGEVIRYDHLVNHRINEEAEQFIDTLIARMGVMPKQTNSPPPKKPGIKIFNLLKGR